MSTGHRHPIMRLLAMLSIGVMATTLNACRPRAAEFTDEDEHLIKPRPAFHYRLPNCLVDEPDWTIAREWNTWVAVERLAHDGDRLAEMSREFREADEQSFRPFVNKWPDVLEKYIDHR
jgi:hypothetical protein